MEIDTEDGDGVTEYSQIKTYFNGDVVKFSNGYFKRLEPNGYDFGDIHIPGLSGWEEVDSHEAQAIVEYGLWGIVKV